MALRAVSANHVARNPLLNCWALRRREGAENISLCTRECALIARLLFPLQSPTHFSHVITGINGNRRLFFREQNPVTILFRQLAPWLIYVIAERHENLSKVLPMPGGRPRRYRS